MPPAQGLELHHPVESATKHMLIEPTSAKWLRRDFNVPYPPEITK